MRIIRAKDYKDMSRKAANIISAQVILKPDSVLGLATGSSPIGTYEQLVKWYEKGDLDFADVTTVNLDEYYGMKPENDQSYHYFMHDHFFDHVNIDPSRINLPNGMEPDEKKECARYDAVLRSVGDVDIQLLGIGRNGHIGFNEPDDCFAQGHTLRGADRVHHRGEQALFRQRGRGAAPCLLDGHSHHHDRKKGAGRCQRRGQGVGYP